MSSSRPRRECTRRKTPAFNDVDAQDDKQDELAETHSNAQSMSRRQEKMSSQAIADNAKPTPPKVHKKKRKGSAEDDVVVPPPPSVPSAAVDVPQSVDVAADDGTGETKNTTERQQMEERFRLSLSGFESSVLGVLHRIPESMHTSEAVNAFHRARSTKLNADYVSRFGEPGDPSLSFTVWAGSAPPSPPLSLEVRVRDSASSVLSPDMNSRISADSMPLEEGGLRKMSPASVFLNVAGPGQSIRHCAWFPDATSSADDADIRSCVDLWFACSSMSLADALRPLGTNAHDACVVSICRASFLKQRNTANSSASAILDAMRKCFDFTVPGHYSVDFKVCPFLTVNERWCGLLAVVNDVGEAYLYLVPKHEGVHPFRRLELKSVVTTVRLPSIGDRILSVEFDPATLGLYVGSSSGHVLFMQLQVSEGKNGIDAILKSALFVCASPVIGLHLEPYLGRVLMVSFVDRCPVFLDVADPCCILADARVCRPPIVSGFSARGRFLFGSNSVMDQLVITELDVFGKKQLRRKPVSPSLAVDFFWDSDVSVDGSRVIFCTANGQLEVFKEPVARHRRATSWMSVGLVGTRLQYVNEERTKVVAHSDDAPVGPASTADRASAVPGMAIHDSIRVASTSIPVYTVSMSTCPFTASWCLAGLGCGGILLVHVP
eukprot:ANDGO_07025.mRNA.1 hypothetical protein